MSDEAVANGEQTLEQLEVLDARNNVNRKRRNARMRRFFAWCLWPVLILLLPFGFFAPVFSQSVAEHVSTASGFLLGL